MPQTSPLTLVATFLLASADGSGDSRGYTQVEYDGADGSRRITVRPTRLRHGEPDPPDCSVRARYHHSGGDEHLELTISADGAASLAGASFACEVLSNHPGVALSVPRTECRGGVGIQRKQRVPADFLAEFRWGCWNGAAAPTPDAALILRATTHRHRGAPGTVELRLHPHAAEAP